MEDIDFNKILDSKKEPYGTITPLCLWLPQMTDYTKQINENASMSFRVNNKQLLKNCNKIWEKIEKLMKINFESKPVYGDDDKYIKAKTKIYADSIVTNFHNKKMPKEKLPCKCLSIIILDSVIKAYIKYVQKRIKIENHIDDDLEKSDSNDETESDIDNDG